MDKCIDSCEFMRYRLDDEKLAEQGAVLIKALLEAQSPRMMKISQKIGRNSSATTKGCSGYFRYFSSQICPIFCLNLSLILDLK